MTGLYNLIALIRTGTPLATQEADARDARAWIVRELPERLDAAVVPPTAGPPTYPPSRLSRAWSRRTPNAPPRRRRAICGGSAPNIRRGLVKLVTPTGLEPVFSP